MTNGTHEDFLLRNIFKEFDVNNKYFIYHNYISGTLNIDELYALTIKLECPISRNYL